MKVLLTKKFAVSDIEYILQKLDDGISLVEPVTYNEEGVLEKINSADVIFGGLLSEAVVAKSSHLAFAQIPWTGVDSLNFSLFEKHQLTVCNSHSNSDVVAEHAIALVFSLAKKITYHDAAMRQGNWNRVSNNGNLVSPFSSSLVNQKITFIGYGAIAQSIHKLLSGFCPEVSAVTNSGEIKLQTEALQSDSLNVYKSADIEAAVGNANWVFVCAPLTQGTNDLVDQSVLDAMPNHSLLINVSRGAIVNESALYHSLLNYTIAGAAIDTWYQNPKSDQEVNFPSSQYEFQKLNNMVMSPHRAGYIDSGFPHLDDAIDNLNRAKKGLPLKHIISTSDKY